MKHTIFLLLTNERKKIPKKFEFALIPLRGKQKVLNRFERGIFTIKKQTQGKRHPLVLADRAVTVSDRKFSDRKQLNILTPKQMLQKLPIALAQVIQLEEIELPDGSYSVSDIQDYFKYIIKKPEAVADNSSIYVI